MKQLSVRIYDKNENVLKCHLLDMEEKIFILQNLNLIHRLRKKEREIGRYVEREKKRKRERERNILILK